MYCTQFQIEFLLFWTFNFSANPDRPYINNVHNFSLNFRSSRYSVFLQIQTFRTYNVQNSPLNFRNTGYSIFLQIQPFLTSIMYTISRLNFSSSGYSISSANPDIPRINNVHNYLLNFRIARYSISLQIQTFRTYNVLNSPLNFHGTGYSIFLQIQPFLTYIMYTISR